MIRRPFSSEKARTPGMIPHRPRVHVAHRLAACKSGQSGAILSGPPCDMVQSKSLSENLSRGEDEEAPFRPFGLDDAACRDASSSAVGIGFRIGSKKGGLK